MNSGQTSRCVFTFENASIFKGAHMLMDFLCFKIEMGSDPTYPFIGENLYTKYMLCIYLN